MAALAGETQGAGRKCYADHTAGRPNYTTKLGGWLFDDGTICLKRVGTRARRVAARPPVRLARRVGVRGAALSAGSCVCVHAVRRAEVRAPSIGGRARGGRLMLLQLFGRRRVERLGGPRMSLPHLEARPAGGAEGLTEDASASRRRPGYCFMD